MNIIEFATDFAAKHSDGHFTIMKFTTNWRASFETTSDMDDIPKMAVAPTLEEAVRLAATRLLCSIERDHWWSDEGLEAMCQLCGTKREVPQLPAGFLPDLSTSQGGKKVVQ